MNTTAWMRTWAILRLAIAALGAAAIIAQAMRTIGDAIAAERDVATTTANFFSFFTIQSNLAAVVILAWAGLWLLGRSPRPEPEPRALGFALAAVSTYMIITGVVYNLLLRAIQLEQGTTVPWSNEVLHVVAPAFLLLDVLFAPRRRRLGWLTVLGALAYPLVWVAYTFIRGGLVVNPVSGDPWWYPYPFLDPHLAGGWASVWAYIVGIAIGIAAVAAIVVGVSRWRTRARGREHTADAQ